MPSTLEHRQLYAKYSRVQLLLVNTELSACICQVMLEYSQILVTASSIQESFFLNTQRLVKVSSFMLVIKNCIA